MCQVGSPIYSTVDRFRLLFIKTMLLSVLLSLLNACGTTDDSEDHSDQADITPPVITLLGANPLEISVSASADFTDPGAMANDDVDGDISANIIVGGEAVDISTPGSYRLTYDVSDAAGNPATQVTRTVVVDAVDVASDRTPPVITLLGSNPLALQVSADGVFTDPGATASDDLDGDISANIIVAGDSIDISTAGTYILTYDVSDAAGNPATQLTREVVVSDSIVDTTPPVITLIGANPLELNLSTGGNFTDPGATATDDVDGDISANILVAGDNVDLSTLGTYLLTYDVSDAAGNAATQLTRSVVVIDDSTVAGSPVWRLASGEYIPAAMTMTVVHPRPDSETNTWARHRNAYPGLRYEIPIGIQGGAWPFLYEIVAGPAGASIGQTHGDNNYGVVQWTAPASGNHDFTVRVTDQELNSVDISWRVSVNTDAFVFLDGDNGDDANPGTLSAPLRTFAGIYRPDESDTSYAAKILVVRQATQAYRLIGHQSNNNNVRLSSDTKPIVWIAYPGESPVFNAAEAKILTDAPREDFYMAGLRFEHGRQDVNNAHFFWMTSNGDRITFFRNHFYDLGPGLVGNDNPGAVFISRTSALKRYILAKQNVYEDIRNQGYNGHYFEFYTTQYTLLEEETALNSDSAAGWFAKGAVSHTTMRANTAVENVSGQQMAGNYGAESGQIPHHFEFCYNNIHINDSNAAFMMSRSTFYQGEGHSTWIYRNTISGGDTWIRFQGADPYHVDGNVISAVRTARFNTSIIDSLYQDNLVGTAADGLVNSDNTLTDGYAEFRGLRGHVLAQPQ